MKFSFKKILFSCFLLAGLAGCIKEDRSECNPGVVLKYDYSLNKENTNLFGAEVGKVTVYVFDADGFYYDSFTGEGSHLTNDYRMHLPLPAGDYTAVVWGGALGTYRLGEIVPGKAAFQEGLKKGVTRLENFMLLAEKGEQSLNELDALWHGVARVASVYQVKEPVTVNLMKNTKLLTVKVKDKSIAGGDVAGEMPYEVYCEGKNGRYMADNSFGKNAQSVVYVPNSVELEPSMMTARLDLLRLVEGHELRVVVADRKRSILFNKDLIEELLRLGRLDNQVELDREDEVEIIVNIDKNVIVSVTINGWNVVEVIPDL